MSGDGCSSDCTVEPKATCGNGAVETGEECDDGNASSYDGCSNVCQPEFLGPCGDGIVNAGENCDSTPGCSPDCVNMCSDPECNEPILEVGCTDDVPSAINVATSFDGSGAVWSVVWNQDASAVQGMAFSGSLQLAASTSLATPVSDAHWTSIGASATDFIFGAVDASASAIGWRDVPAATLDTTASWNTGPDAALASKLVATTDGEVWAFTEQSDRSYHLHALVSDADFLVSGLGPDPLDFEDSWSSRPALDADTTGRIILAWFDYSAGMRLLRVEARNLAGAVLPVGGGTAAEPYALDSFDSVDLRYVRIFWLADGGFALGFIVTDYGAVYGRFFDAASSFTLGFATGAKGAVPSLEWDVASREDGTVVFAILSEYAGCRRVRMMVNDATPATLDARMTAFGPDWFVASGTHCSSRTPDVDVNSAGDAVLTWLDDAPRACGLQVYARSFPELLE